MSSPVPFQLGSKPGIKRDGTVFEGEHYVDGRWVRFQRGLPRKMLGYRRLSTNVRGKVYGMNVFERNNNAYIHTGDQSGNLDRVVLDQNGTPTGVTSRTPAGLTASTNYLWQFATMYNAAGTNTVLIGHPGLNLNDMLNSTGTAIYFGDVVGTGALIQLTGHDVPSATAGGVCVSGPYLFVYDDAGYITWSGPTQPTDFRTSSGGGGPAGARVVSDKVLRGLPLRAGVGAAPATLFWSTNALIRASFVGSTQVFQFDTISDQITCLSSSGQIEYNGVYYWPGIDRFYQYTGVVDELDNQLNNDWFFNGVNKAYRQKVFAFKVPRFGEIWWCYPRGSATECTHAVIFNVRESRRLGFNVWYDTELPAGFRTAAAFAQLLGTPIVMDGVVYDGGSTYSLWQHETGYDEVTNTSNAVQSYFETSDISLMLPPGGGKPAMNALHVDMVELDMIQQGDMTFNFVGRQNARASLQTDPTFTFGPTTQVLHPKLQRRILRMRMESNVSGGYYEMGQVLIHVGPGTATTVT
jgi:hypothetical protein